ncbi:MAG: DMT family transporter [Fusobacteriaceae bacterium]
MNYIGEMFAVGAAFGWLGSSVMFEKASKKVSGMSVNIIRLLIAMVILMGITTVTRGLPLPTDATKNMLFYLSVSGMMGLFVGDFFLYQAYNLIGARITLVLMSLSPIIVSLFGFVFLGEKLVVKQLIGIAITCTGVMMVVVKPAVGRKIEINFSKKGILFAVLAVLGESVGIIFTKMGSVNYDAFATTQLRSIPAILAFIACITYKKEWKNVRQASRDKMGVMYITLGTLAATLGVCALVESMKYAKVGVATTIASTSPILIIPISIFYFKEKITRREIIGAGISVLGVSMLFV